MNKATLTLILTCLLLTSCRFARTPTPLPPPTPTAAGAATPVESTPEVSPLRPAPSLDIRYSDAPTKDVRHLSLDVYPSGQRDEPVLIFVHGGGWTRGNKSNVDAKPAAFNERGFVFVSVGYRFIPEVDVAKQTTDVARAIAWVKQNIASYGGDPTRIFLMGHSAGAHLVSLIATDETYLAAEGLSLANIRGVIALDTQAYDLNILLTNMPETNGYIYRVVFGDDPENWTKFSPITYVATNKNIPPFFLVYTGQKHGRSEITELFAAVLQEANIPATVYPAIGKTHGEVNTEFGLPNNELSEAAFTWLEKILAGL